MSTNHELQQFLKDAADRRLASASAAQRERRREVDERNAAIQAVGPRPVDGTTFGKGKPPK